MRISAIENKIEDFRFYDWAIKIECASQCAWSAELRITLETNPDGPDMSTVFFATGAENPEIAAEMVYNACKEWRKGTCTS